MDTTFFIENKKTVWIAVLWVILISILSFFLFWNHKDNLNKEINTVWILRSWDPENCNQLWDEKKINTCKDNLYYDKARTSQESSFCENIWNDKIKSNCNSEIIFSSAIWNKNMKMCDKLSTKSYITECKNSIVMNEVYYSRDLKKCDKYEGNVNICKDALNLMFASTKSDKSFCEKVTDKNKKDLCIQDIDRANIAKNQTWSTLSWIIDPTNVKSSIKK